MSFRAILGPNAIRQALRRREDSTPRDQRTVHEASRLVFCVFYGIPVREIHISDTFIQVQFDTECASNDVQTLHHCIQMVISGVITVQAILGQGNQLFEPAVAEAHTILRMSNGMHDDFDNDFDLILSKCSKMAIAHLANPKFVKPFTASLEFQIESAMICGAKC